MVYEYAYHVDISTTGSRIVGVQQRESAANVPKCSAENSAICSRGSINWYTYLWYCRTCCHLPHLPVCALRLDAPLLIGGLCRDTSPVWTKLEREREEKQKRRVLRVFRHCGFGIFLSSRVVVPVCHEQKKMSYLRGFSSRCTYGIYVFFLFFFVIFTRIFFPLYGITRVIR